MKSSIISFMQKKIITVDLDDTAEHVEAVLDIHKLSCVPVVDSNGKTFGVISATDFVHFYHSHRNPKAEYAWELCTHKVIEASKDISIIEASELLVSQKIHHLIIIDNNSIQGIVSAIDLLKAFLANKNA